MNKVNLNLAADTSQKQGTNPLLTGLEVNKSLILLKEMSEGWDKANQRPFILLRALIDLSLDQPDQAKGFTSNELVDAVRNNYVPTWGSGERGDSDPERFSTLVRQNWSKLEKLWQSKTQGIVEHFQEADLSIFPDLDRTEGGGRAHPTRYRIKLSQDTGNKTSSQPLHLPSHGEEIRYFTEDLTGAPILSRLFQDGYPLVRWRVALLLGIGFFGLVFVMGLIFYAWLILTQTTNINALITGLVASAGLAWIGWVNFGALYKLPFQRIVIAPWWLQGFSSYNDRLLELHDLDLDKANAIHLTRYMGTCLACNGKVRIQSGGREFHGRLIGSCENSPKEHIYSFDYITRQGTFLR